MPPGRSLALVALHRSCQALGPVSSLSKPQGQGVCNAAVFRLRCTALEAGPTRSLCPSALTARLSPSCLWKSDDRALYFSNIFWCCGAAGAIKFCVTERNYFNKEGDKQKDDCKAQTGRITGELAQTFSQGGDQESYPERCAQKEMVCLQKRTAPDSEAKGYPEGQKAATSAQQSEAEIARHPGHRREKRAKKCLN